MKQKSWISIVFSFASQCRGKIALSVLSQAILPRKTGKEKNRCRAGSFVRPKWIFRVLRRF